MSGTAKFGPRLMKVSIPQCSIKNLPVERGDFGERCFEPHEHAPVKLPARKEDDSAH
jgi:hypothetical protein